MVTQITIQAQNRIIKPKAIGKIPSDIGKNTQLQGMALHGVVFVEGGKAEKKCCGEKKKSQTSFKLQFWARLYFLDDRLGFIPQFLTKKKSKEK